MANKRKKFSPEEKVRLLRLHLVEKVPVSDICDQHGLNPSFSRTARRFSKGPEKGVTTANLKSCWRRFPNYRPNLPQPERLAGLKGKLLDNNEETNKNNTGWRSGRRLCRGATCRG